MKTSEILERAVKIGGHLLRPGEDVLVLSRAHAGRHGKFKGQLADGRLVVRVRFGVYGQTLLRLERYEVELERSNSHDERGTKSAN